MNGSAICGDWLSHTKNLYHCISVNEQADYNMEQVIFTLLDDSTHIYFVHGYIQPLLLVPVYILKQSEPKTMW